MTLADRIRRLSSGYQGMDDQECIASEVEKLEAMLSKAEMLAKQTIFLQTKRIENLVKALRLAQIELITCFDALSVDKEEAAEILAEVHSALAPFSTPEATATFAALRGEGK